MSGNRRLSRRKDEFRIGTLQVAGAAATIDCLVWDLSPGGAWIEVAEHTAVDRFLLSTGGDAAPRACTVVRREGGKLGVRFEASQSRGP